jgi:hypothetical protein
MTTTATTQNERAFLRRTGSVNKNVFAGIQADDCVVWKKTAGGYVNHSLCNHTCVIEVDGVPTGGSYICDSSFIFANGAKGFAPRKPIVDWTKHVARAHFVARDMFFDNHYDAYCQEFCVPPTWAHALKEELTDPEKKVECNRFGSSPEIHPECPGIVSDSIDLDLVTNVTTPGRKFITDTKFVNAFAAKPPQFLAMSFDDVDPDQIERLSKMDLDQIKAEWKEIPHLHGQRQKAYEGLYAAKLMQQMGIPVKILWNVVTHAGNVGHLDIILQTLKGSVPGSFVNAFPAQSFGGAPLCWTPESLPALRKHVLKLIVDTLEGNSLINPRIMYYIMLEAAFRLWWPTDVNRLCQFMSGIAAWDATLRPGGYRYAQIASNAEIVDAPYSELPYPGGHLTDFWNRHVGLSEQIDSHTEALADTLTTGWVRRGQELRAANKMNYVQTSSIMPRLALDMLSTELGIPFELVETYLVTRLEFCGF